MNRLKVVGTVAVILQLASAVFAWGTETPPAHHGQTVTGGAGGPVAQTLFLEDGQATLVGGHGGVLIKDAVMIGGGGYLGVPSGSGPEGQRKLGYGGLRLELFPFPHSPVNVSLGFLGGAGGLDYESQSGDTQSTAFLAFEPGINVNIQVASFLTLSPGVRYLHTVALSGGDRANVPSGFAAALSLRFGKLGS